MLITDKWREPPCKFGLHSTVVLSTRSQCLVYNDPSCSQWGDNTDTQLSGMMECGKPNLVLADEAFRCY